MTLWAAGNLAVCGSEKADPAHGLAPTASCCHFASCSSEAPRDSVLGVRPRAAREMRGGRPSASLARPPDGMGAAAVIPVAQPRRRCGPPVQSVAADLIVGIGGGPPSIRRALGRRGMSSRLGGASGSPSAPAPPYRPWRAGGRLSTWSTPSRRWRAGVFRRSSISASDLPAPCVCPGRRGVPVGSIVASHTPQVLGPMSRTFGTFVRCDHHPIPVRCRVTDGKNRDGPMRGQGGAG